MQCASVVCECECVRESECGFVGSVGFSWVQLYTQHIAVRVLHAAAKNNCLQICMQVYACVRHAPRTGVRKLTSLETGEGWWVRSHEVVALLLAELQESLGNLSTHYVPAEQRKDVRGELSGSHICPTDR